MVNVWIYALTDPRTHAVMYIGQTINMRKRLTSHVNNPMNSTKIWINELKALKLRPQMVMLELANYETATEKEEKWYKIFNLAKANLLNRKSPSYSPAYPSRLRHVQQ